MNILKIAGFSSIGNANNSNDLRNKNITFTPQFGLKLNKPLTKDTVSFQGLGTPKSRSKDKIGKGVTLGTAKKVEEFAKPHIKRYHTYVKTILSDLIADEYHPNRPIKEIGARVKSGLSIKEKSETLQLNSKDEVLDFMTDILGIKIILRDANPKYVEEILNRFIPDINRGKIEIPNLENKRPIEIKRQYAKEQGLDIDPMDFEALDALRVPERVACKYDYAPTDALEKIKEVQETKWNGKNKIGKDRLVTGDIYDDYSKGNYCAIHMIMKMLGKNIPLPAEIQLRGIDEEQAKIVNDKGFKFLNGKDIPKKYNQVKLRLAPLLEKGHERDLSEYNRYSSDVMIDARTREVKFFSKKAQKPHFLELTKNYDISDDIAAEVDYNRLYDIIQTCDFRAKQAEKNLKHKKAKQ